MVCLTEASSGPLAGVLSAIIIAAVGAVAGYFTYQQKKLCFKSRQGNSEPEPSETEPPVICLPVHGSLLRSNLPPRPLVSLRFMSPICEMGVAVCVCARAS